MTPPDKDTREAIDELHAAELLYRHNLWRRGDDTYDMANPKELGIALDMAVKALRHRPKVSLVELSAALFDLENEHKYPAERPQWKWLSSGIQEKRIKKTQAILDHLKQQRVQFDVTE